MKKIQRNKIEIGDKISITDNKITSWSTNICVSAGFSLAADYGIVIKYECSPEEIMLDTRMLVDQDKFYFEDQSELILLPGKTQGGKWEGSITRKVTIELISWNSGKRTPSGILLLSEPYGVHDIWVSGLNVS
jgi:hypothetical protein